MPGKKLLIIVGKPGSGKSTTAAMATRQIANAFHFSVGDELRAIGLHGKASALSSELSGYSTELKFHRPVPPELATKVFEECVASSQQENIIVDGYPQYANLLPGFEEAVMRLYVSVIGVCHVTVPDAVARARLTSRGQRSPDVVENEQYLDGRLLSYRENTIPTIEKLAARYPVFTIDGSQQARAIADALAAIISAASSFGQPRPYGARIGLLAVDGVGQDAAGT